MTRPALNLKLLIPLAALLLVAVLAKYGVFSGGPDSLVSAVDSVPVAEKRLEVLRRKAALIPGREQILKTVQANLQDREKGILTAGTAEQARAHLLEMLHSMASKNGFPAGGADTLPQPKAMGKEYGQVSVGQSFTCAIEQLVNLLSDISNQAEAVATDAVFVSGRNSKDKTLQVRLTLAGVVPKKLVPEKKGLGQ
jgi:hypothetical protein